MPILDHSHLDHCFASTKVLCRVSHIKLELDSHPNVVDVQSGFHLSRFSDSRPTTSCDVQSECERDTGRNHRESNVPVSMKAGNLYLDWLDDLDNECLATEISEAHSRLGDLVFLLKNRTNKGTFPGPTSSAWVQTELLGGELEGMGHRLLLYRNRMKSLEQRIESESKKRNEIENELIEARETQKEIEAVDRDFIQQEKENQALREANQLQEVKLQDMDRLINYYIDEVKSLESRLKPN